MNHASALLIATVLVYSTLIGIYVGTVYKKRKKIIALTSLIEAIDNILNQLGVKK